MFCPLKNTSGSIHTFNNLLIFTKLEIKTQAIAAQARRHEIKSFIDETHLDFNKNIIDEKKQMEGKIIELENKINKLIKVVYNGRGEDSSNFERLATFASHSVVN